MFGTTEYQELMQSLATLRRWRIRVAGLRLIAGLPGLSRAKSHGGVYPDLHAYVTENGNDATVEIVAMEAIGWLW